MAPGQELVGPGRQTRRSRPKQKEAHRLFWAALAAPGIIWLALLFVVPFYAILAIAGVIGYLGYRFLTRGERGTRIGALTTIAGEG